MVPTPRIPANRGLAEERCNWRPGQRFSTAGMPSAKVKRTRSTPATAEWPIVPVRLPGLHGLVTADTRVSQPQVASLAPRRLGGEAAAECLVGAGVPRGRRGLGLRMTGRSMITSPASSQQRCPVRGPSARGHRSGRARSYLRLRSRAAPVPAYCSLQGHLLVPSRSHHVGQVAAPAHGEEARQDHQREARRQEGQSQRRRLHRSSVPSCKALGGSPGTPTAHGSAIAGRFMAVMARYALPRACRRR